MAATSRKIDDALCRLSLDFEVARAFEAALKRYVKLAAVVMPACPLNQLVAFELRDLDLLKDYRKVYNAMSAKARIEPAPESD